jgi:hypothetical protein
MEAPNGKEYDGPSGVGRDSVWLTAEDLVEGRDANLTVESVILYPEVAFQGGRKRLNLLGLKFAKVSRVLGLNATNRKIMNKMFGNISKTWKGQKITLYVTETQMAGETVKCVRIRDRGSRVATAAEEFLHDDEPKVTAPSASNGADDAGAREQAMFDDACSDEGIDADEKARILAKHSGDPGAAYKEVLAMSGSRGAVGPSQKPLFNA